MTKHLKTLALVIAITLSAMTAEAQDTRNSIPKWVPEQGYWVIEGNIKDPLNHTVRFFNNENVLVYKETLSGVKLNPDKRKVKMKLKKVLETAVIAWNHKNFAEEDKNYVAALLK